MHAPDVRVDVRYSARDTPRELGHGLEVDFLGDQRSVDRDGLFPISAQVAAHAAIPMLLVDGGVFEEFPGSMVDLRVGVSRDK